VKLIGGTFTDAERQRLFGQGVDTVIDASGKTANLAPNLDDLAFAHAYSSGGIAFLDRHGNAALGGIATATRSGISRPRTIRSSCSAPTSPG
jgi:hypothetical protein